MNREKCPECKKGFLYPKKDGKFTLKICYVCGYYWNDSKGYDELSKRLFRDYFPTLKKWEPSPEMKRSHFSPEDETKPDLRLFDATHLSFSS